MFPILANIWGAEKGISKKLGVMLRLFVSKQKTKFSRQFGFVSLILNKIKEYFL